VQRLQPAGALIGSVERGRLAVMDLVLLLRLGGHRAPRVHDREQQLLLGGALRVGRPPPVRARSSTFPVRGGVMLGTRHTHRIPQ